MKLNGFYSSLVAIAIPISLQALLQNFVNMLDTIMIGRLGSVEIAAVGLGNQIFFILNMILFGITSGGGVFFRICLYGADQQCFVCADARGDLLVEPPRLLLRLETDFMAFCRDILRVLYWIFAAVCGKLSFSNNKVNTGTSW